MSDFDIDHLATLARLKVDNRDELQKSIKSVLAFVDQIKEANVSDVEPKDFFRLTKNRLREDTDPYEAGTFTGDVLRVAPKSRNGYFEVKKIIDNSG